jgi:hypothetical protein
MEQTVNITIRVLIVAAVVAAINVGAWMSRLTPGNVVLPARDIRQIPLQLGQWSGESAELNEYQFQALGATRDKNGDQIVVDRIYRNPKGEVVWFNSAVFSDYGVGLFHEPKNCFRSGGYHLVADEKSVQLEVPGGTIEARLGTWENSGAFTQVLYWYELGKNDKGEINVVHDRSELGSARWALKGKQEWPSLIKFLLVTSGNNAEAETRVKNVAEQVIAWFQSDVPQPATDAVEP